MRAENCKPGARVRYWPVRGQEPSFVGTVRLEPWQLGDGTWVTHLKDLDRPGRTSVHAARVDGLSLEDTRCGYEFSGGLTCQLSPGHRSKFHRWQDAKMVVKFWPYTEKQLAARARKRLREEKRKTP